MFRRFWNYLKALLTGKFEEVADPKIQIEQAIAEARSQHRRLRETAASVIANQKKAQMDLDRALEDLEKLNRNTQQAVIMASEAEQGGEDKRVVELTQTAEAFANQLIAKEQEVDTLKSMVLQATRATEQAKAAVTQNAQQLQAKVAERQKLLSQLDQAKMAEQMNRAMESMSAEVGQDVPTLDEVRSKIETRLTRAQGTTELERESVGGRMLEVEQAAAASQAAARLSEIRSKLGIEAPAAEQTAAGESATASEPAAAAAGEPSGDGEPATADSGTDSGTDSGPESGTETTG
ncbi:MAG: PspA/IM30 family protein [Actinobacteria bacterium]|nr:PspA/IM30 family protein [Actinomycetota bacterium]